MVDIEQMFYQVKVKEEDQDFLRFLWWPSGELTTEPQEYCMTVHLLGAGSSPGCSNYALKRTADDHENEFGTETADTLRRNFYVDDALKSVATEEDAVDLVRNVKGMCRKGGFNLTKFVCNSVKVNHSIPFGWMQGPRAFGGPRRFFGPRGCLWRHVFRDRTARFWADILYMYRGAGAPRFNIKYESRTFLCI